MSHHDIENRYSNSISRGHSKRVEKGVSKIEQKRQNDRQKSGAYLYQHK